MSVSSGFVEVRAGGTTTWGGGRGAVRTTVALALALALALGGALGATGGGLVLAIDVEGGCGSATTVAEGCGGFARAVSPTLF